MEDWPTQQAIPPKLNNTSPTNCLGTDWKQLFINLKGLPETGLTPSQDGTIVVEDLRATAPGDVIVTVAEQDGTVSCLSTPMRVVADAPYRHYWGDLHRKQPAYY